MASSYARRYPGWILGKIYFPKVWSRIVSGGVTVPGGVQEMCRCDSEGHGLVGMMVIG